MGRSVSGANRRRKGSVQELPSGALRVSVYAGIDPVTKQRKYLKETIPASTPKLEQEADKVLRRLLVEVDESRQPRTNASVTELVKRHLDLARLEETTLRRYRGLLENHIAPLIGGKPVGKIEANLLDSFYAELQRCRLHCDRKPFMEHRTDRKHECDARCRQHECNPLAASSVRQIHFILSGAFKRAVRWKWVSTNPIKTADPPAVPPPDPDPPTAEEAARILDEAFRDPAWGALVWLAMTTGIRRGELCALRWSKVDLGTGVIVVDSSVAQDGGETWLKKTKTHQQRRITLDPETVLILRELHAEAVSRAGMHGTALAKDSFVFSRVPDGSSYLLPDSVGQRFTRASGRLGIDSHLHTLRHYSATELIAGGVDPRTVAGRLGHSGGGTTTLRVYSAFVSEADQRASQALLARLPSRPVPRTPAERARLEPRAPFERIAAEISSTVARGEYKVGDVLPGTHELVRRFGVSANTIRRAFRLLVEWGTVNDEREIQATEGG